METNFVDSQYAEDQSELVLERETLLYKMASKTKSIRGYLSELREIRTTLKMADALVQMPTITAQSTAENNNDDKYKTTIMETMNNYLTEHQFALKEQQEVVNEISKIDDKFAKIDVIYNLETADEVLCALAGDFEKLNNLVMDYISITSLIDPAYLKQIKQMLYNYEGVIGVIERDEKGCLHCGDCLVSYNHCQDIVGEMVIISHITLNTSHHTRNKYKAFANQIDLVN